MSNTKKDTEIRSNNTIDVKNARVHNLKNVTISIHRDAYTVITGVSGSGKSSLAFDTIYAEGHRRYVESLSSYARQFLGRIAKPEVDFINGLPPAIALEQKVTGHNPRSTVGTSTEIYDYLRVFFSRVGDTYHPQTGKIVKRHSVTDVVNFIVNQDDGLRFAVIAPYKKPETISAEEITKSLIAQGVSYIEKENEIIHLRDIKDLPSLFKKNHSLNIVIDRLVVKKNDQDMLSRLADSIQSAFNEGNQTCIIKLFLSNKVISEQFSHHFESDGMLFEEPTENLFSFNNPLGACPICEGYGKILGIDEDLVIPDKSLSLYEDTVACWKGESGAWWKEQIIKNSAKLNFPIHKPYFELTSEQKHFLWHGNKSIEGINQYFEHLESKKYKIQNRVQIARFRDKTTCTACNGKRLRKEASYVKINNTAITDLIDMPINQLKSFFEDIVLDSHKEKIAHRLLIEIQSRINFLYNVGLGYLTLNRLSASLSGGESQRIQLATTLGSSLVGSLYVLDEPSIGLHSRDTSRLIEVIRQLRDIGNTLIVVEHDEDIIKSADYIVDMGPMAGHLGGEVTFNGTFKQLMNSKDSITAKFINGIETIDIPISQRKPRQFIELKGVRHNNLKNINVRIPLGAFTAVTGVSGSGKSTLIGQVLYPALMKKLGQPSGKVGEFTSLGGETHLIKNIEFINQNPIGKSSRSNPVTYIKAYDDIRTLYSNQKIAKQNLLKPASFSFNVPGGRCEDCQGEGHITIEMQFMANVELICESCNGKKFKEEVLEVVIQGKNIFDILEMTVDEAIDFFNNLENNSGKKIAEKLNPLAQVGLNYIKLGQSSSTLSGGESQRVKLASFLTKGSSENPVFFIFDEPTTGLHFNDINKLLNSFYALLDKGHTIVVIEHNLDVVKCADWIIDLGPEGGNEGGRLLYEGHPNGLLKIEDSHTAKYLKDKLLKK